MSVECSFSIANAVVNVVSVVSAGLIGYFSARRISKLNEFIVAAAKLRAAFGQSLMCLNLARINEADPMDIHHHQKDLEEDLPKVAEAIEEFRSFVRSCDGGAYQTAWEDYYKTIKSGGVAAVLAYDKADPWGVVEKKIQTILSFAKRA